MNKVKFFLKVVLLVNPGTYRVMCYVRNFEGRNASSNLVQICNKLLTYVQIYLQTLICMFPTLKSCGDGRLVICRDLMIWEHIVTNLCVRKLKANLNDIAKFVGQNYFSSALRVSSVIVRYLEVHLNITGSLIYADQQPVVDSSSL